MNSKLITAEQYLNGVTKFPKSGTLVSASVDGKNWNDMYFVQLGNDELPFICVEKKSDIHFPASKGTAYNLIKINEYGVEDVILKDNRFFTRDGLYETNIDNVTKRSSWQRTDYAIDKGVSFIWVKKEMLTVDVSDEGVENAIKILNNYI